MELATVNKEILNVIRTKLNTMSVNYSRNNDLLLMKAKDDLYLIFGFLKDIQLIGLYEYSMIERGITNFTPFTVEQIIKILEDNLLKEEIKKERKKIKIKVSYKKDINNKIYGGCRK